MFEEGLAYNLVFINVRGASKIIAIYFAVTALIEYFRNLFIKGMSLYIFLLNIVIRLV
jgi:hypothetical protein